MHLLRTLTFFTAYYDIEIMAEHIPGVTNTTADHLSRNNMLMFFCLNPQAYPLPTPLPQPLLAMLTPPWERIGPQQTSDRSSAIFYQRPSSLN